MEQYSEVEKALGTNIDDLDTAELEDELRDLLAEAGGAGAGSPGPAQKAGKGVEQLFVTFVC